MSLTFYGAPMSTASITEAVLAELAIPHARVMLDISAGDTRAPAFLELNPNGRVPVIVHDGTPIWESSAITMYLGEVFGLDRGLYPGPGPRRGEAMKWIAWSNVTLAEAAGRLAALAPPGSEGAVQEGSRDWIAPEARDTRARDRAREDLAACLAILDGGLADREFLLGDYSLADTHAQGLVGWIGSMLDLAPFSRVRGWLARCAARPALAAMMADAAP